MKQYTKPLISVVTVNDAAIMEDPHSVPFDMGEWED